MSKSLGNGIDPQRGDRQARRRDHPPVGGRDRLLGRHRRSTTRSSRASSKPTGASATRCASCWPTPATSTSATDAVAAGRHARDRPLCAGACAAQFQADGAARTTSATSSIRSSPSCRPSAPKTWARSTSTSSRTASTRRRRSRARAARRRPRCGTSPHAHAALDGAVPVASPPKRPSGSSSRSADATDLHPRSSTSRRRYRDTKRCWPSGRAIAPAARRGAQAPGDAARAGRHRLVAAGRSGPARRRRSATRCSPAWATSSSSSPSPAAPACIAVERVDATSASTCSRARTAKCERCWHYRADVGAEPAHPGLCGRCADNLFGAGEDRQFG